jgi:hypothetical protein
MQWPNEIIAAFSQGMDIEPLDGLSQEQVIRLILDETARRALWRAKGDPRRISGVLRWPFTPLGSVVPCSMSNWAESVTLHGRRWNVAVDAFYDYFEENVEVIFDAFRGDEQPYRDGS